jgi:hypothetical protein
MALELIYHTYGKNGLPLTSTSVLEIVVAMDGSSVYGPRKKPNSLSYYAKITYH